MPTPAPASPPSRWRRGRWRATWHGWWLRRQTPTAHLTLTHRNLYILPTRAGLMLGLTLLLLLVGSINYQLNLGYLLTFLLAGCAVVALHVTHNNLRGLRLSVHGLEPVFAGQAAPVQLVLHNPGTRHRYGVGLAWLDPGAADASVWADVPPQASATVQLSHPTQRRGPLPLPALRVETRFPLGTVSAWHWWRPAGRWLVYPAPETPEPALPRPDGPAPEQPPSAQGVGRSDETDGVRPHRRGDPLKWVLWKKVARLADGPHPAWVSRDFAPPSGTELWLDHAQCGLSDPEAQRSRLCAWVLRAETLGLRYGLRLPGLALPPDQGPAHRRRCLEALACH
ncbi:DUF58 domain-containing protein [Aquabacterium sp. A08]|uniref:DUF58 domain-containing protein n=1 Tax=Aquabacterium sp. A08 TaxID=2718532 RepID=UPI00142174CB|nr:DUF58 domain-containing protein [Aquabacterium sp. A08]NIC43181.1 DUF58 domain-containing protein [Aquabacterium sp. A08]